MKKYNNKKKTLNKYNSLKMDYNITTENNNNIKNKNPEKTPSNKSKDGINRRKSKKKSNISSVHQKQYEHMFTNVEKTILENIRVNDLQKKEIFEQKKNRDKIIDIQDLKYFTKDKKIERSLQREEKSPFKEEKSPEKEEKPKEEHKGKKKKKKDKSE